MQALADVLLHEAVRVEAASQIEAVPEIEQRTIAIDASRRTELLCRLVQQGGWRRVLVFVATRYATEHVTRKLASRGVQAARLHGEMSQSQRTHVLQDLREGAVNVLVTTDLAARGIDVTGLGVVVNYDLPRSPEGQAAEQEGQVARRGSEGARRGFAGQRHLASLRFQGADQDRAAAAACVS